MFFTQSRRLNEELKSLSVYSLRNSTKTTDSVPSASSPGRTPQYPISSIKEDQEKDVDNADSTDNIPVQSDSDKQSTTKTQPVAMRRTNSHPKLVSLYGSGKFKVGRNKQPVTLFFVLQNVFDAMTFQNPISFPNFQESWK